MFRLNAFLKTGTIDCSVLDGCDNNEDEDDGSEWHNNLSLTLTAFWPLATDGVAVIDEDEDDRSEWHNNPFTLHSYLTIDGVVVIDEDNDKDHDEWHNNTYTRGAYSYVATDGDVSIDDDDADADDGSGWQNNPYTRGAHSCLTTDSVVSSDDGDDHDDGDDDDGDDADDDDRSEWQNNPYIRGAYSYLATGVPLELHDMLRQPLPSIHVGIQLRTPPSQQPYVSVHTHQRPPPQYGLTSFARNNVDTVDECACS